MKPADAWQHCLTLGEEITIRFADAKAAFSYKLGLRKARQAEIELFGSCDLPEVQSEHLGNFTYRFYCGDPPTPTVGYEIVCHGTQSTPHSGKH